ncbi:hypothetical protein NFI96_016672, partial [Prochilodus magdalenae]
WTVCISIVRLKGNFSTFISERKKMKRLRRKCCALICCAAVEDDEVSQEPSVPPCTQSGPRNIWPSRLTPKDFMTVLENSLAQDKADEEEVVDPASEMNGEVTVFFRRSPVENLSGNALFDLTKGTYFTKIHNEVTESIRAILPPEMRDTVNSHTTFSLTSSFYDDMLKQMNCAVMKMVNHGPGRIPLLTGTNPGSNLLLRTMKKLQDFWQICRVCCWLRASRGSPVNIHDQLEAVVAPLTLKVVALLNNSPEGTSKGAMDCGLDAPLRNFLLAVADKIRTEISPDSNVVDVQSSAQEKADPDTEDRHPVADCSDVTVTSETVMNSEGHQASSEHLEPPAVDSKLESSMLAASSGVVSALVSELKSTIKEDLALVDPSVDPLHYTTQVQLVSDKVLKSIQATMKEVLMADIFSTAIGAMTPEDDAQLHLNLVTCSKQILRSIIDHLTLIIQSGDENIQGLNKQFLQSAWRCIIIYKLHLACFSAVSDEPSGEIQPSRRRRFTVRMPRISLPKLRLRLRRNMEPTTALPQNQPVPNGNCLTIGVFSHSSNQEYILSGFTHCMKHVEKVENLK